MLHNFFFFTGIIYHKNVLDDCFIFLNILEAKIFFFFKILNLVCLAWLILSTYFRCYSWVSLYFLILFMSLTVLFQLTFTFIYITFNKKKLCFNKISEFQNKQIPNFGRNFGSLGCQRESKCSFGGLALTPYQQGTICSKESILMTLPVSFAVSKWRIVVTYSLVA